MPSNYETLSSIVQAAIAHDSQPTSEIIRQRVEGFRRIPDYAVSDAEADRICKEIEARLDISMNIGSVIKEEFEEWLTAEKANIDPYYWERYRKLLVQKNFPHRVIARLDEVTDRIVGLLENPQKSGPWDRRGMVVGHVQSGKTANYTGLLCKAADAGYKLIIVIAGIHNNLRNQTQARIDEGFVGRDSAAMLNNNKNKIIGVGRFDSNYRPVTLTNTARDFNKQTATANGMELRALNVPAVLVIKKNVHTLTSLIEWLRTHNMQHGTNLVDAPMLLIDDEADNASINISKDSDKASRINSLIRELLSIFSRSCYVGYTATPFANIFIDPESEQEMIGEDLFPRNFIISLDPPSNYFGADKIFGEDASGKVVKDIVDNGDTLPLIHKIDFEIAELPQSLLNATRAFVLARAIRILRGQPKAHNSMLVNASRFIGVQRQLRDALHDFLASMERRIRYESSNDAIKALKDSAIQALYIVWEAEYSELEISWTDIFGKLLEAVAPISVIEVNSKSATALDYDAYEENGRHVIAVGGFSLSRGLTLEGLTISYFLRNSVMYDTLMQMGRWFGYRQGYEDVCRVWMSPDAAGWYEHIAESIEELRDELRDMELARMTPEDFGLKVRSHPANLIVTARNKMGSAEKVPVKVGLSNAFIETYALVGDRAKRRDNLDAARALIDSIARYTKVTKEKNGGSIIWSNVPTDHIKQFLSSWENHEKSPATDPGPVIEYINRRNPEELMVWDVVLVGVERKDARESDTLGQKILCQGRSVGIETNQDCIWITNNYRVASRGAEKIGLTDKEIVSAEKWWQSEVDANRRKKTKNVPDLAYRRHRSRPLLLLHLLDLSQPDTEPKLDLPVPKEEVIAWGISFPVSDADDPTVEYVVTTTWMREAYANDIDEDDMENSNGK